MMLLTALLYVYQLAGSKGSTTFQTVVRTSLRITTSVSHLLQQCLMLFMPIVYNMSLHVSVGADRHASIFTCHTYACTHDNNTKTTTALEITPSVVSMSQLTRVCKKYSVVHKMVPAIVNNKELLRYGLELLKLLTINDNNVTPPYPLDKL